jgi:hypothetical protein
MLITDIFQLGGCFMENPAIEFLLYLIGKCIEQCQVDPDETTVSEFMRIIVEAETPLGV